MSNHDLNNGEEEDHSSPPLTHKELRHLRRIMKTDERARWFWSTVRTFAAWLTAVAVAVIAVKNTIIDVFMSGKH